MSIELASQHAALWGYDLEIDGDNMVMHVYQNGIFRGTLPL